MITTSPRVVVVAYNEFGIRIGETHQNARIPDEVVDKIRERYEDDSPGQRPWGNGFRTLGAGYRTLAREFGLSESTVRKILTYERRAQTAVRWKRVKLIPVSDS